MDAQQLSRDINQIFQKPDLTVDYWNIRVNHNKQEWLSMRQGVLEPTELTDDIGAIITVFTDGGQGYCATADLSLAGLAEAASTAKRWAQLSSKNSVIQFNPELLPATSGEFITNKKIDWFSVPLKDKIEKLAELSSKLKPNNKDGEKVVDWHAALRGNLVRTYFISSNGSDQIQEFHIAHPNMSVTAFEDGEAAIRNLSGTSLCRQSGFELLHDINIEAQAQELIDEAIQLLKAPNCPTGTMDVLLHPDQMMLQIHESIGHPIEIDRILGDERNFAGTSFVTKDMFGSYQYGSNLLNITFDPTVEGQLASCSFDDEGELATREFLIKDGILVKGLGGSISQKRSGISGVACSRASDWNRPAIDRMGNLNLEPGTSTFDEMVCSIEKGVLMKSNRSWSIDDSRNKFQFGCEYGQMIENGKLSHVVKNPNYRGVSASFWRNLAMVGDANTFEIYGTPFCGKGEPGQAITVGHASPFCVFKNVEVFGGEA